MERIESGADASVSDAHEHADRPGPTAAHPLEVRGYRRTFASLPEQVHDTPAGDAERAAALRARWRSEYAFLYLGLQDELDAMLAACDRLADRWSEAPTAQNREWFVDALYVAQSALIDLNVED